MSDSVDTGASVVEGAVTSGADVGTEASPSSESHWYSELDSDLQSNPNITKYQSANEMARGHISAVSMIGRDKLAMPKTDSEYREVYKALGMPETVSDYVMPTKAYAIPEDLYPSDAVSHDAREAMSWAHEAGLSQKQFDIVYDKYMSAQVNKLNVLNSSVEVEMARCKDLMNTTWGEATDVNVKVANRAMVKYFGEEGAEAINRTGLGRNFSFIQGLYNLGSQNLEELGIDKRGSTVRTPDQLKNEVAALQNNPAYFDSSHPEHQLVNDKVMMLMERLYPTR